MEEQDPVEAAGQRGLSRRQLVKRAAAAGIVAWSAPTIVQSLTSPAGAQVSGAPEPKTRPDDEDPERDPQRDELPSAAALPAPVIAPPFFTG